MKEKTSVRAGKDTIGRLILRQSIPSTIGILSYNLYHLVVIQFISPEAWSICGRRTCGHAPIFLFLSALAARWGRAASIISGR